MKHDDEQIFDLDSNEAYYAAQERLEPDLTLSDENMRLRVENERLKAIEIEFENIANFCERHWKGAGLPKTSSWIIEELVAITESAESAHDENDQFRELLEKSVEFLDEELTRRKSVYTDGFQHRGGIPELCALLDNIKQALSESSV